MATKKETLEAALRGEGCLGRAADDEPVFVLRAHDTDAPRIVSFWAKLRAQAVGFGLKPPGDVSAVAEAGEVARAMAEWRFTIEYPITQEEIDREVAAAVAAGAIIVDPPTPALCSVCGAEASSGSPSRAPSCGRVDCPEILF